MLHVAARAVHFLYVSQEEASSQLPSLEPARLKGMVKAIHSVLGRQFIHIQYFLTGIVFAVPLYFEN